jgi:hypothetical protein
MRLEKVVVADNRPSLVHLKVLGNKYKKKRSQVRVEYNQGCSLERSFFLVRSFESLEGQDTGCC